MRSIIIPTTQNIELEYPVAEVLDRSIARLIDYAIQIGYLILVFYGAYELNIKFSTSMTILLLLPAVLYSLLLDIVYNGQTLGKKVRNLRVIRQDGSSPSWADFFLRWVCMIVESGMIGFLIMSATKKGQRLGDLLAGTTVIKEELIADFDDTIFRHLDDNYQMRFPQIEALSDKDIAILKEVLDAGVKSRNVEIIERLARRIKEVIGVESQLSDESFLEIVLQDYNYLYGRD